MDYTGWNLILYIFKWVFIGLVYLMLSVVVLNVRREMSQRVSGGTASAGFTVGRLRVVNPGSDTRVQVGSTFDLKPVTRLGTDRTGEIVLHDQFISKQHARLRWDGATWWLEDLGSRNGSFLNQAPVQAHIPVVVPPGALIKLGDMTFELLE